MLALRLNRANEVVIEISPGERIILRAMPSGGQVLLGVEAPRLLNIYRQSRRKEAPIATNQAHA